MNTLLLGAKGMLGHALKDVFPNALAWDLEELDITREEDVRTKLLECRPEIVINAAAYTDVDGAEEDEERALRVNGAAVGFLADACLSIRATLVHYSTDYVFGGTQKEGYRESDAPKTPVNAYGRSKRAGEKEMLARMKGGLRGYLIRTSWLYGENGKNFVDTMVALGKREESVSVVNDQYGKPTYTADLARTTKELLYPKHGSGDAKRQRSGIYHVTNETPPEGITWHTLAKEAITCSGGTAAVAPCTTEEFPRPAKRPTYSVLRNTKIPLRRSWRLALKAHLKRIDAR